MHDEIEAGKVEVMSGRDAVVVNIVEDSLYTPESKTFSKDTQTRLKLGALLKKDGLKGKDIFIGNTTEAVAGRGKGKKRVPPREALFLASERSAELVKSLIKEGVPESSIAALAYSSGMPDRGFKIKNRKTTVMIGTYPPVFPQNQKVTAPAASGGQKPRPAKIPIKPAEPQTTQ